MDPNNNQPIGTNPIAQPAPQPVPPTEVAPVVPTPAPTVLPEAPPAPQNMNIAENPKKGGRKIIILIILILILIIGIGVYILFAKSQLNNTQKTSTNTAPIQQSPGTEGVKAPSILQPTSQDDLNIESPEADLQGLDADVNGL